MRRLNNMIRAKSSWALFCAVVALLIAATPGFAQFARNRYALVLSDPPVASRYSTRESMTAADARAYRQTLESRQRAVRQELESRQIVVTGAVATLMNAIFVVAPPERVEELKALPGVAGVVRMRLGETQLNAATQLVNAPAAWALGAIGGQSNAGKGIKIAILDSGIDQTHPAFADSSLPMPAGFPICTNAAGVVVSGQPSACPYATNKVIVARSYVRQIAGFQTLAGTDTISGPPAPATSEPDDYSARDRDGHGTAVASAAAGIYSATGGTVPINGVAPKAYLGSYKIYGSPGVNDSLYEDVAIQAIDDAFVDGMDVANLSSGFAATSGATDTGAACGQGANVPCDPVAYAFEQAAQHQMVITVSAGNYGANGVASNYYPVFNSITSPAIAPSVIAVGATLNSHAFGPSVSIAGPGAPSNMQNMTAVPSDSTNYNLGAISAPLVDVSQIGDVFACSAFPANSLNGAFALIERSLNNSNACTFAAKASNASDAGAIGVIIYLAPDRTSFPNPFVETVQDFYGPLVGMSNADGATLKNYVDAHPGTVATIDPSGAVRAPDAAANLLASYSSFGPSLGAFPPCAGCAPLALKPDLVATGGGDSNLWPDTTDEYMYGFPGMYMAAENYDPLGELYSVNRFAAADGTSFSSAIAAGAAALARQAHPAYTGAQIKSALVNWSNATAVTASDLGDIIDARWMGAGLLDAAAAAQATIVASPTSVTFGAILTGTALPAAQAITIANLGSSAVTLALAVAPQTTGATITLDKTSLSLSAASGSSANATFHVSVTGAAPAAGVYAGQINLTATGVAMHIPYLFLVGANTLSSTGNMIPEYPGEFEWFAGQDYGPTYVQLVDSSGVPVTNSPVTFSVSNNALTLGSVAGEPACTPASSTAQVICNTDKYGFAWIDVVLGPTTGSDDVIVSASNALSNYIQIDIRQPPAIGAGGVVMNGSFTAPVAPGSYVSIFGTGLTDYTDTATTATLPLSLDNVTVSVDVPSAGISVPARMVHVTQLNGYDQLDIQMPWEAQGQTSAQMKVTLNQLEPGNVVTVPVANYAPAFFHASVDALDYPAGNVIGSSNPVARGGVAQIYAHGLGPVNNQPASGSYVTDASATTVSPVTVKIGGQPAQVIFAGLAPNFPGEYQVNIILPTNIGTGNQPISMTVGGVTSAATYGTGASATPVVIPVK